MKDQITQSKKKLYKKDINKSFVILYLVVLIIIVIGEIALYKLDGSFTPAELFKDIIGNLMGVLAAFLIFDFAHEKLSKDSYVDEITEQILDTLMYHPEAIDIYENNQKKEFIKTFVQSVSDDPDASDMINSFMNTYLLTHKDLDNDPTITGRDCRIRKDFKYNFILETDRTSAFKYLRAPIIDGNDPYFYVQEQLSYRSKILHPKGDNMHGDTISFGLVYSSVELDKILRDNSIFRENLDICDEDKQMFEELKNQPDELMHLVDTMFRPMLRIDGTLAKLSKVQVQHSGLLITFDINVKEITEHTIDIIFHIPKRWDTLIEIAMVEPTKGAKLSVSYNEDMMELDMYSFLNKGKESSYDSAHEGRNGIYSITIDDNEWIFPVSGVIFAIHKK